jgi:exopolyphosphatase/guanosine-5'-triphosphate,3'-diphosphate pyrophosphatase
MERGAAVPNVSDQRAPARSPGRVGVIDIGSNSVRLVVYEGGGRNPDALFNEKVLCGLGRHLGSTGRLDPDGVGLALATLDRFAALSRVMGIGRIEVVATAAVRDASDGTLFVAEVEARTGVRVRVLSGTEEAAFAAQGVLSAIPDADGLVGDLGGGSLELVTVGGGAIGTQATLPLGPLRLQDASGGDRIKAAAIVDKGLEALPWIQAAKGKTFYAVGGAWRSLARIHMAQTSYPLRVLHHYRIVRGDVRDISRVISNLSRESLERMSGLSRRRIDTLPYAALVLDRVLKAAKPNAVVFSAFGLREGLLFTQMPEAVRRLDPLIETARAMGARLGRFAEHGDELMSWTSPLFPDEDAADARLRLATCHLSDIGWRGHPDYRAQQTLFEILRGHFVGIDHRGRAMVALGTYCRYDGDGDAGTARQAQALLDEHDIARARVIGLSLRLGHTLSGGTPRVLERCPLVRDDVSVTMTVPRTLGALVGDVVQRRFTALARTLSLQPRIESSPG